MADKQLSGIRVAVLVTDGVEQVELLDPKKALEKEGAEVVVISPHSGKLQGFKHHDQADKIAIDMELNKATAADFDAVLLPGGVINADALRIEKKAQEMVREMDGAGKPIAVICHGAWLLISAGLCRGRTMTSWPTLVDDLRCAGVQWIDQEVVRDRNWVSSRKPDDIPAFNREMIRLFGEAKGRRKVA